MNDSELGDHAKNAIKFLREALKDVDDGFSIERRVASVLAVAWAEALRQEWERARIDDEKMTTAFAVARKMMRSDGYGDIGDPICCRPGLKPFVAMVDGLECFCFDFNMAQAVPLSAIYASRVAAVMEIMDELQQGGAPAKGE